MQKAKNKKIRTKKSSKEKDPFELVLDDLVKSFRVKVLTEKTEDSVPYIIRFRHRGLQAITGGVPGGKLTLIEGDSQSGKCLTGETEVATPYGPKPIAELKVGDQVFGWNADGTVSPTKVLDVIPKGCQRVYRLLNRNRTLVTCTKEHKWLSASGRGYSDQVMTTSEIEGKKARTIKRVFVNYKCGDVDEPHAYALGALMGNGCSVQGGTKIYISSPVDSVPHKVAKILGADFCYRNHETNYTYTISTTAKGSGRGLGEPSDKIDCHYYDDWVGGRLSGEKTASWEVVDSWNRESILNLLAGLIDTDGSVYVDRFNILNIAFSSTSFDLADIVRKIIYKVFQLKLKVQINDRSHHGKSIEYTVKTSSNFHSKRILKSIDPMLVNPSRKYKNDYDELEHGLGSVREDQVGFVYGQSFFAETYDIEVDNETHLYVLHNEGLITHNSFLVYELIVECLNAGGYAFLSDIENALQPRFMRRVGLTNGKKFVWNTEENMLSRNFAMWRRYVTNIRKFDKTSPILIAADSFPAMQIKVALEEIAKEKDDLKGYMAARKNAEFSQLLGEFTGFMSQNAVAMVWVNQLRYKMNVMFGDSTTVNAENIFKYYANLRIRGRLGKKIKEDMPKSQEKRARQIGVNSIWETIKNREIDPFKKAETEIIYKEGVKPDSGLLELLVVEQKIKESSKDKDKFLFDGKRYSKDKIGLFVEKFPDVLTF